MEVEMGANLLHRTFRVGVALVPCGVYMCLAEAPAEVHPTHHRRRGSVRRGSL